MMRIDKYLADCGLGSRKTVKALIRGGRVTVNGIVAKSDGMQIDEARDKVIFDGKELIYKRYLYLMLHKPTGVVSATYDARDKTVIDLVPPQYRHFDLFPVGRLDIDTTGLLFLTNDGALAHRLTSPKHHADKVYFAQVAGEVGEADVEQFSNGVRLEDGYLCKSAVLRVLQPGPVSEIELTIREGKFHQVKRMFEAVGKSVLTLKRLSMGGVALDETLKEGELRELTQEEIDTLQQK